MRIRRQIPSEIVSPNIIGNFLYNFERNERKFSAKLCFTDFGF